MTLSAIVTAIADEGISVSKAGVCKFLKRYRETGTLDHKKGSSRPSKITPQIRDIIDNTMVGNDETTVKELKEKLEVETAKLSCSTVLRCRRSLGWTHRGSAYCQLIREGNKAKRLAWATQYLPEASTGFNNVIYTDESSVQLEAHRQHSCHRIGQPPCLKPRYSVTNHQ